MTDNTLEELFQKWEDDVKADFLSQTKAFISTLERFGDDSTRSMFKGSMMELVAEPNVLTSVAEELLAGPLKHW